MTTTTPARRRRLGAALGALVAATAAVLTAPGTAHAGYVIAYTPAFELRNAATGKCLEVADWRTDVGAPVRQWTCTGGANQQWKASNSGFVVNQHSQLCLDVPGGDRTWGTQPIQYTCSTRLDENQRWRVPGASRPSTGPMTSFLGTVLDVYGFDPSDGAPVVTWGANGGDNQIWTGPVPLVSLPPF
ncbi:RICIN domain-containing protein [Kitasatospora sp. NPDC008115]|uniref:RICIN domain-containing protein n=1 Tax=Kitasatospora sp. NPDC008115 TaxID=3364022 RepID=UPI0036F143CD